MNGIHYVAGPLRLATLSGLAAFLLGGCSGTADLYSQSDVHYCAGDYGSAVSCIVNEREVSDDAGHVLDNLYIGAADFAAGKSEESIGDFGRVETGLKEQDFQWDFTKSMSTEYVASTYDETMVNFYRALSFLEKRDIDRARVEFNRVDERQGRAAKRNSDRIQAAREKMEEEKSKQENQEALKVTEEAKCEGISELQAELDQWNPYSEYMNPAAVFMCGAFLMVWGEDAADCESALAYMKRAYGMQPAKVTERAIGGLEAKASGSAPADDGFVVVLFENGMGPLKVEERKEIIIPYRYPIYAGVALPALQHRQPAFPCLNLMDGVDKIGETELICDLDRVVAAEFREEFKWIATSAYVGACIKVGIQIALLEGMTAVLDEKVRRGEMSRWSRDVQIAVLGAGLSAVCKAITSADTRIWSTLPHEYQAAIVPRPKSGVLALNDPITGRNVGVVEMPKDRKSAFVYVKMTNSNAPARIFSVAGGR